MPDTTREARAAGPAAHSTEEQPIPTARPGALRLALLVLAVALVLVLVGGIASRVLARRSLHTQTEANAVQAVSVTHPRTVPGSSLVLPARLDAWYQAPVYARTNGYLKAWYVDIGSRVHAGQVMAEIETPEVDQELVAARAALATAQAQLDLAEVTAARWQRLLAQNAVSRQEEQDRTGAYAARLAMRNQAAAEVSRLVALTGFKQLLAPFDGVVTARNTDIGDLIVAGAGGSAPLFTVADLSRLRVYASVPQDDLAAIHDGLTATFSVPEMPGRGFSARLVRTAHAVDPQSDAMLVELVYDNRDGKLKPGAYADLTFTLPADFRPGVLMVPSDALLFRANGTTVAVAQANGTVRIEKIRIVDDLGTELEVSSGLTPKDQVIDSPNDGIGNGDQVRVQQAKPNRDKP